ncbi:MAG: indole acetimide hydrolase [Chloroflexi bacterium CFX7]|nr:indole acetimide hydrolase [Chloroflexi bacterium CFX7]RIL01897.1 MAG: indole acetimide hydrolase [bacterium]
MTDDLWRLGVADLADAIRARRVTGREVVQAHLDRIAQVNGAVNAVTVVLAEQALAAADEADRAAASGRSLGPLHGVPFTVKENIDLVGSATTNGLTLGEALLPPVDSPHIAQLKAAGAIPIARTNMPDVGLRWHTGNALRGETLNPWNADLTPGGSSGGDAAALATGMTPLGMGNDVGGSLRWPSQCCGTAAIRPTLGRVPEHLSLSAGDRPMSIQLMAVEGPMARHVRDLALALSCMTGRDSRDPWWTPVPLRGEGAPRRVAVTLDPASAGIHPDVEAGVLRAADALRDAGYEVCEIDPPRVADARETWFVLLFAEIAEMLWPSLELVLAEPGKRFLELAMASGPRPGLLEYMQAFATRLTIAREWARFLEQYPLVLGPVSTQQPFVAGWDISGAHAPRELFGSLSLVVTVNLLGLPSLALPVGVANGLPQGVQLIGDRYREDLRLAAGQSIEERLGVFTPVEPRRS